MSRMRGDPKEITTATKESKVNVPGLQMALISCFDNTRFYEKSQENDF